MLLTYTAISVKVVRSCQAYPTRLKGSVGSCKYVLVSRLSVVGLGSVSSRECLDAPAILATFTAGRTGLVIV